MILLLTTAALISAGCRGLIVPKDGSYGSPATPTPAQPSIDPPASSASPKNTVLVPALTQGLTTSAQVVDSLAPVQAAPGSTNIYVVNPGVTRVIDIAQGVNAVSSPVNPWAAPIGAGLALVSSVLAWYARRQTQRLNRKDRALKTVVRAVEQTGSNQVKERVSLNAQKQGESDLVNAEIQKSL